MKKLIYLGVILFCLTGCSSYTELNDLSIVSSMGIDYQNNQYHLVVGIIDGKLDDDTIEKSVSILESKKASLEEAIEDLYLKSNKKLYLSHLDLLVLTKSATDKQLRVVIENFLKNNEYRNNFDVVVLEKGNLANLLEENTAEDIHNLIKTNQKETGFSSIKDFESMLKELLIDGNTYLPTLSYLDDITLNGYTLVKDYHVYEVLSLEDSILLNVLENNLEKAYFHQTNIFENQTQITTKNNQVSIRIITTTDKNLSLKLKSSLQDFLMKYQEDGYDILKLQEKVRQNNFSYYQETKDLLSKLQFSFRIEIKEKENYLKGELLYETK